MPHKLGFVNKAREICDFYLLKLPLPNINPSIISFLAIPASIGFILLWDINKAIAFILLFITICFDWLDGIIAKKYHRTSERGWIIDSVTDRISEGIIFFKFFNPWFYLFLLNVVINIIVYKTKKVSLLLPLRILFTIYIILFYSFYYFLSA